jgi:hypothetical protein
MPRVRAGYRRIVKAQQRHERNVRNAITFANRNGRLWRWNAPLSVPEHNAVDRLEAKGEIIYRKRRFIGGYALTSIDSRNLT